jgi:WD40 repeat protein
MLHEHTGAVGSVSFSPNGKLLASGSYDEHAVRLWDVKKREEVAVLKHTEEVGPVSFSPDGKLLAAGGRGPNNTIKVWALPERNEVAVLTGHTGGVESLSFSPDGKLLASGSEDRTVRFWDVAKQKEVAVLKHNGVVGSVSFSPDGELLASGGFWPDNTVRLWDVEKQKEVAVLIGHTDAVWSVAFSPNGKWLASGSYDKTVRLWDVEGQKEVAALRGHTHVVFSVAFSPDGKWLASGSNDGGTVRLWDVEGQKEVAALRGHTGVVYSVAFSPSGKWLASGSNDGTVLLWEVNIEVPGWRMEPAEKQLVTWGRVKHTALYQNYPNPFNPETWIPFRLAKASDVTISIYAQSGQLVRTLRLGYKEAGYYLNKDKAAYWDGRDSYGEEVASGVYFYTMEAGKFKATKKMAIAR